LRYLLDTNAVIAMLRGHPTMLSRLREREPADFGMSAIVFHELSFGAHRGTRTPETLARIEAIEFETLAFEAEDARRAGELRATLAAEGVTIGPYDVLIAGQALARNLVLITHNTGEFGRVAGLRIEDWEI
jgi:tRNA(fMet)-specific endonuclease VapC